MDSRKGQQEPISALQHTATATANIGTDRELCLFNYLITSNSVAIKHSIVLIISLVDSLHLFILSHCKSVLLLGKYLQKKKHIFILSMFI